MSGVQRVKATDRAGSFRFYTTEELGPRQSLTPEGFLLCEAVPIARTGVQMYSADEVPIEGVGGRVTIYRDPADVFRSETVASFEAKSVTTDHPDEFVNPANWKMLTGGVTLNVRRGEGPDSDLLLADLLVTDQDTIAAVRNGLREVSCGYEADYEQTSPGVGYQRNIVGNHVALVERGRAGPRCSIKDGANDMAKPKSTTFLDRLFLSFQSKDVDAFRQAVADAEAEEKKKEDEEEEAEKAKKTGDRFTQLTADVAALVKVVDSLVKSRAKDADEEEEEKKKEKTDDEDPDDMTLDMIITAETAGKIDQGRVWTGDKLTDIVSRAEVLVPGFAMPTTDSVKTLSAGVKTMARVIDAALQTDAKNYVLPFLGTRTVDSLTVRDLRTVFTSASELAKNANNGKGLRASATTQDFGKVPSNITSINEANQKFWASRGK